MAVLTVWLLATCMAFGPACGQNGMPTLPGKPPDLLQQTPEEPVWRTSVPLFDVENASPSAVWSKMESVSRNLDPEMRGIFVLDEISDHILPIPRVSHSSTNAQLFSILDDCVAQLGISYVVMGRCVFLCHVRSRTLEYTVRGVCTDESTGQEVEGVTITCEDKGVVNVTTRVRDNGEYECVLMVLLSFLELGGSCGYVVDQDFFHTEVRLKFLAPGYEPRIYTNALFGSVEYTSHLDAKLRHRGGSEPAIDKTRGPPQ